jgi:hypothetical protein
MNEATSLLLHYVMASLSLSFTPPNLTYPLVRASRASICRPLLPRPESRTQEEGSQLVFAESNSLGEVCG